MQITNPTTKHINGYPSWDHWNVALWMLNDERLYNLMANYAEGVAYLQKKRLAGLGELLAVLPKKTPDGAIIDHETLAPVFFEEVRLQIENS